MTHRHVTPPKARKHTRAVHCVRADSLETWRYQVEVVAGKFLGAIGMEGMTNIVIVIDIVIATMQHCFYGVIDSYLVGGLEHGFYFPFHIWDVILRVDEFIFFKMVIAPPTSIVMDLTSSNADKMGMYCNGFV